MPISNKNRLVLLTGYCNLENTLTFNTMFTIKIDKADFYNRHVSIFGGCIYCAGTTNKLGDRTMQQGVDEFIFRPNFTGTFSGGILTWWAMGHIWEREGD